MIAYLPVLIISLLTFLIGEIIMWPFVYTKMVFHKLTMVWVYSKSYRISRADKFANFIIFSFIGPFTMIATSLVDTFYFLKHLLRIDLQKIKHKIRNQ
jgi:hypothetical protein